jgi:hypothetical protein
MDAWGWPSLLVDEQGYEIPTADVQFARLGKRAKAVYDVIERVAGFASLAAPIADMEGASAGALPELGLFLPRWVRRLERLRPSKDDWETAHERGSEKRCFVWRASRVSSESHVARSGLRARFAVCARGAHAIAATCCNRIAELVVDSRLRGKVTVFQKHAFKIPLEQEIRKIRKFLRSVYLQTRGEVAERLKAAVC